MSNDKQLVRTRKNHRVRYGTNRSTTVLCQKQSDPVKGKVHDAVTQKKPKRSQTFITRKRKFERIRTYITRTERTFETLPKSFKHVVPAVTSECRQYGQRHEKPTDEKLIDTYPLTQVPNIDLLTRLECNLLIYRRQSHRNVTAEID